ncbi:acyltransferase family protein [Bradyrhizobium sp. HKCCYLRH1062]|uniref:acyltransferase family protein n=1 Tax=unclassified Bradyrhizobium TaxID=2631580 RepID=UPI003EBB8AA6
MTPMIIPKASTWPKAQKLLGLEGLRFLATVAVLLWHYQHFAFVGEEPVGLVRSELPFYRVLFPFYEKGKIGVEIFWCISGFIFFWKYSAVIADRTINGWTFFVYRLARLYPLHLATLLLVTMLQLMYFVQHNYFFVFQQNDIPQFVKQLFMASDWLPPHGVSFNAPIWSVSIEIVVYAAFFLSLRVVRPSPLFNLAVIVISIATGTLMAKCFAFFYAGGLAAMARQAVAGARHRPKVEALAACASIAMPAAFWMSGMGLEALTAPLLLIYTPILLFCCSKPIVLPRRLETLVETAGNTTYSCYLLHFPIQLAIALAFSFMQRPIPYLDPLFSAAFVLSTLVTARLTYCWFEAPAQRLVRTLLLRRQETRQASPVLLQ